MDVLFGIFNVIALLISGLILLFVMVLPPLVVLVLCAMLASLAFCGTIGFHAIKTKLQMLN